MMLYVGCNVDQAPKLGGRTKRVDFVHAYRVAKKDFVARLDLFVTSSRWVGDKWLVKLIFILSVCETTVVQPHEHKTRRSQDPWSGQALKPVLACDTFWQYDNQKRQSSSCRIGFKRRLTKAF
jgi:hypothetical protein